MQQLDLESLVAGGHGKDACETLVVEHGDAPEDPEIPDSTLVEVPADFPPESFWLSKDAEFDWFDRNAFLERKESTRGNSNSMNLNPNVNPGHSNPNSQRVRSKRCRSRRRSSAQASQPEKSASQRSGTSRGHKTGFMSRITSLFRSEGSRRRKNCKSSEKVKEPAENPAPRRICVTVKPVNSEPGTPSEPPALGGMMRFASGRRPEPESWGGSDDDVAGRHSLDSGRHA
ncbi:hypothetical protein Ccrd_003364 [Cynara cardunculus var. scolymus]|uniref:Uncharacterized protein n=1 Tax=Cynara cardunculus var. scolymus TaxID=59895 RepID=A0A124SCR1_CYNCS|nr:hypothetical protein Ccrd_003364 [Cynara cardunculus var. scolymus]